MDLRGRLVKALRFHRNRQGAIPGTPTGQPQPVPAVSPVYGYSQSNPGTSPIVLSTAQVARITNNGALTSAGINVNITNRYVQTGAQTIVLPSGGCLIINGASYSSFVFGTSTASLFLEVGDPSILNTPTILGKMNVGQSGTWTVGITSGSGPVEIADSGGNVQGVTIANGGTAPCNGVGRALVIATASDPITLSDGTTTGQVVVMAATAQWFQITFPVKNGVTYTFAGTGLALLGAAISITAG